MIVCIHIDVDDAPSLKLRMFLKFRAENLDLGA